MESSFPPLYARWLESFFGAPIPAEPAATCSECPMLIGEAAETRFHPQTKCCTFFPEIPSFSIGGILLDEHPAMERGRELIMRRIEIGQQVTPVGIGRPGVYYNVYGEMETFGITPTLLCPYYINEGPGLCGVWRHREATCATWFCKHERGRVGVSFWHHIRRLLRLIEDRLVYVIALEHGVDEGALEAVRATTATLHRDLNPDYYAAIWDPWAGREIEYYKSCARAVADLDWAGVRTRCGDVLDPLVRAAEEALARLRAGPKLPELVQIRPFRRVGKLGDTTTLKTYSPFDSLVVPDRVVFGLLEHEVATVEELCAEPGVDRALLEKMLDAGLLEDGAT